MLVASRASGNSYNWDLSGVPLNWGLDDMIFKIAPSNAAVCSGKLNLEACN